MTPLQRVAEWADVGSSKTVAAQSRAGSGFDVEAFLDRHGLKVRRRGSWNGGKKWELERCPINPTDHIGGCAVVTQGGSGALGFKCHHNSCTGIGWIELREFLEPIAGLQLSTQVPTRQQNEFQILDLPSVWTLAADAQWLVDGFIPESAVTLLTGDSGCGKTTLALALAGAVAHGTLFLGRRTVQKRVLYVDRENPLTVVKERLHRLGIPETDQLSYWGGWCDPGPDGPLSPSIIRFVRDHRPLLVFDSLVAFHDGKEQDASETRRHLQGYRNLAALGGTPVILHHTGKAEGSKQYRGSSDIKAAVDCAYLLDLLGDPSAGLASLRLTPFKNRFSLVQPISLQCVTGRFSVASEVLESQREIIERVVKKNPSASETELVQAAMGHGIAKHRAESLFDEGLNRGWLKVDVGRRGRRTYRLPEVELGEI